MIRQAQVLGSVAEIVRRQNEPYRGVEVARGLPRSARRLDRCDEESSRTPLSSRIIKAANAFDDLVGSSWTPAARRRPCSNSAWTRPASLTRKRSRR